MGGVQFSADGKLAITHDWIYDDAVAKDFVKTVRLWDLESGKRLFQCQPKAWYVSSDCHQLLEANGQNLSLWDLNTGKKILDLKGHVDEISAVCLTPDGKYAIPSAKDKTLRLWDIGTATQLYSFDGLKEPLSQISISPNGQFVAGEESETIRVFQVRYSRL